MLKLPTADSIISVEYRMNDDDDDDDDIPH